MKQKVARFIVDELLSGREVGEQDDLLLSGLIDSIGVMRLVAFIEEITSKSVPPEEVVIENFVNIEAIGHYLKKREDGQQ